MRRNSNNLISRYGMWLQVSKTAESEYYNKSLVSLDANILLSMYELGTSARHEVMAALRATQERLWVSDQAALEFSRNRRSRIQSRHNRFHGTRKVLEAAPKEAVGVLREAVDALLELRKNTWSSTDWEVEAAGFDSRAITKQLELVMRGPLEEIARLEAEFDVRPEHTAGIDPVLDQINELLTGRIGQSPSPRQRREAIEEATSYRFPNKIPPGYADEGKDTAERSAGDYLIWLQLMEEARKSPSIENVLFVTNETKGDWWTEKGQTHETRPELAREMLEVAGKGLRICSLADFLRGAKEHLDISVSSATVEQVQEVADEDRATSGETWNLLELTPTYFELLVKQLFQAMDYESLISRSEGGDQTMIFHSRGITPTRTVVQAKRYRRTPIGPSQVRELMGIMVESRAQAGFIVTTSWFTRRAAELAKEHNIVLVDGPALIDLLRTYLNIESAIDDGGDRPVDQED